MKRSATTRDVTRSDDQTHEELRSVGVGSRVGHSEDSSTREPKVRVNLISELVSVDGSSSSASACGITGLDHEILREERTEGRRE